MQTVVATARRDADPHLATVDLVCFLHVISPFFSGCLPLFLLLVSRPVCFMPTDHWTFLLAVCCLFHYFDEGLLAFRTRLVPQVTSCRDAKPHDLISVMLKERRTSSAIVLWRQQPVLPQASFAFFTVGPITFP
jgi:hypothetical protein